MTLVQFQGSLKVIHNYLEMGPMNSVGPMSEEMCMYASMEVNMTFKSFIYMLKEIQTWWFVSSVCISLIAHIKYCCNIDPRECGTQKVRK